MATINKNYNFSKLQSLMNPTPRQAARSIDFDNPDNQQSENPEDFTKVSGGNAFTAIAEANKNVDQSAYVDNKKNELSKGLGNLTQSAQNKFNDFKSQNQFNTKVDTENLINSQDVALDAYNKLQQQNVNNFKDEVNENVYDNQIKSLNENANQFTDQNASQGNRALDAYLLGQSGVLNKSRNELIQQANAEKANVKALRDSSSKVVDQYEQNRKEELGRVNDDLAKQMSIIDEQAKSQGSVYAQQKIAAARESALQKLAKERDSEIAKWQGAIGKYNQLKVDDTAPVRMDPIIADAQNKINELRNQDLNALIKRIDYAGGDKYSDEQARRFNKIASLIDPTKSRQASIIADPTVVTESNFNRFGAPQEFKAIPKVLPNEGPSTQDKMATTIKEEVKKQATNPIMNPVGYTVQKIVEPIKNVNATPAAQPGGISGNQGVVGPAKKKEDSPIKKLFKKLGL